MLTRSGWVAAIAGAVLLAMARLTGPKELYILGGGALILVLVCVVFIWLRKTSVVAARSIRPNRLSAGSNANVQIQLTNSSNLPSPVLRLIDRVGDQRDAVLELSPVAAKSTVTAGYRLPTKRRGLIQVGPLRTVQSDPFGLTRRQRVLLEPFDVLVYPHVDVIDPPKRAAGDENHYDDRPTQSLGASGTDFFALREYQIGDDLRRVHWASSARRDELFVRQDEQPQQSRVVIVLDTRRTSADEATFEQMVSAAASVIQASARRGDLVRFTTLSGFDTGFVPAADDDAAMQHLATVYQTEVQKPTGFDQLLHGRGAACIFISGADNPPSALNGSEFVVRFQPRPQATGSPAGMIVGPNDSFERVWQRRAQVRS